MADQQSNETIRQMMSGFSAMQYNLGLLPMPQAQAMAGATMQPPPPPPQVAHPSEAALQAVQTHQNMMQQTLQAAQMTRYTPPPSAPIGAMSMYAGAGVSPNPGFVSPLGGGGGGFGGGAPSPFMVGGGGHAAHASTAPFAPRLPSIFNPFAPTLPSAHFATPAMRNQQLMQHAQAQTMGTIAGVGEAVFGLGGSIAGGALGSAFGPLGTAAGSYLGGKIGGAISSMVFNPVTADYARGRQIQQMTAPFMVAGSNLNTATGSGLDPRAARDVASGIRHLARDHDFERTGFNTQDAMRIMQSSASAGLLTGATSPDQIVQKVKDISKTVKVLMQITGDPDVRSAIHSLGQMRDMGFNGLASQAGAVANRMSFARMAGQSPAQMMQTMMAGGDIAGQYGLVGATGAMAGGFGAGAANVAASAGSLNDLQLARAGGRAGLGQTLTQGSLAAMQNDQYLLSAMGRDSKGRMTVDLETFRKNQTLSFGEVQRRAADALRSMGPEGIFQWNTQKNELKDMVAQKLRPGEMQQMMIQQAKAFQAAVPGMSLGTAIEKTTGMSADQARALELMANSRQYWQGLANQARVDRSELAGNEKAAREQYRTQGLMTQMRHGIGDALGSVSDTLSSPFRSVSNYFERTREVEEAAGRGERISRYDDSDIASDDAERQLLRRSLRQGGLRKAYAQGGPGIGDRDPSTAGQLFGGALGMIPGGFGRSWQRSTGRQINRITSSIGLGSTSDENRLAAIADYSKGRYTSLGESFGDADDALARVQDVVGAAQGANMDMTGAQLGSLYTRIGDAAGGGKKINSAAILSETTAGVVDDMKDMKAGRVKSARAMSASVVKERYIAAATKHMSPAEAERSWEANKSQIISNVSKDIYASGDKKTIEVWEKSKEVQARAGGVDLARSRDAAEDQIKEELKDSGMGDLNDKTMTEVKSIVAHHDDDTIALATAIRAQTSGNDEEKERGLQVQKQLFDKLGAEKYGEMQKKAQGLATSMSDDTADAFERTMRDTHGVAGVQMNIQRVRTAAGHKMEMAARNEFTQKLASRVGRKDLASMSPEEAAASLKENELDQLDDDTKKAVMAFRGGDSSQLDEMISRAGPSAKTTRHSDASSAKLRELDDQIANYEKSAAAAKDDSTPESLQAKAADLFANSVSEFATAVKDLKGGSELDRLEKLSVSHQSKNGDS